jgi:hypothetical protein
VEIRVDLQDYWRHEERESSGHDWLQQETKNDSLLLLERQHAQRLSHGFRVFHVEHPVQTQAPGSAAFILLMSWPGSVSVWLSDLHSLDRFLAEGVDQVEAGAAKANTQSTYCRPDTKA